MKIVIVGSDGQLGTDCQNLLADNHYLITPTLAELDLCSKQNTLDFIIGHKPDIVINCAAYTAVDNCEKERDLCAKVNARGAEFLAISCREVESRLIHISTDYVFDGTKPVPKPYYESDETNPLSHYGRTKLEGEKAVVRHCPDYVILRTAWLYSATGANFLKTMLRLTYSEPDAERKVVHDQYGSLTWSRTLAGQVEKLLTPEVQGVVHGTAEGSSNWYEAACYFLEKMGIKHRIRPCSTSEYPTPAHRPANSILANGVLDRLKLSVFRDWREDLDLFVADHGEELLAQLRKH